jgi:hypothetical protein
MFVDKTDTPIAFEPTASRNLYRVNDHMITRHFPRGHSKSYIPLRSRGSHFVAKGRARFAKSVARTTDTKGNGID